MTNGIRRQVRLGNNMPFKKQESLEYIGSTSTLSRRKEERIMKTTILPDKRMAPPIQQIH